MAAQGQALELAYSDEAGLAAVEAQWEGHRFPLVKHDARWIAVVGVDLDAKAGAHAAEVTFRYGDGRSRSVREPVTVNAQKFPTTELKVEDRYVELSPEDAARAAREAQETDAIYATLTSECIGASRSSPRSTAPRTAATSATAACSTASRARRTAGADLRADDGTPVYAVNRGRVVLAKDLFYSGNAVIHRPRARRLYHVSAPLEDQRRAGHDRRARPTDRARGRDGPGDRAAPALGRADRRRARGSVLASEARGAAAAGRCRPQRLGQPSTAASGFLLA